MFQEMGIMFCFNHECACSYIPVIYVFLLVVYLLISFFCNIYEDIAL